MARRAVPLQAAPEKKVKPRKIPRNYAEAYLECRDPSVRHMWIEDERTSRPSARPGCWVQVMACGRCTTVKIDYFSGATGDRVGSTKYIYPVGFKLDFVPLGAEVRVTRHRSKVAASKRNPDKPAPRGSRPRLPDEIEKGEMVDLTAIFASVDLR